MRGYIPPCTPEEQTLVRRVQEAVAAVRGGGLRFLGFLDERGRSLAQAQLNRYDVNVNFWGGFKAARRWLLGLSEWPLQPEDFPLSAIRIRCYPGEEPPSHRDYLGALMGLGIKRECIGDILVVQDGAICFVEQKMADFLFRELISVGRCPVHLETADIQEYENWQQAVEPMRLNVASLRADTVLAALLRVSRGDAAALIERGAVLLCGVTLSSTHTAVEAGDSFSVRGYGHFRIAEIGGESRKGRLWLQAEKFIG